VKEGILPFYLAIEGSKPSKDSHISDRSRKNGELHGSVNFHNHPHLGKRVSFATIRKKLRIGIVA
jgi:hypothetical protein